MKLKSILAAAGAAISLLFAGPAAAQEASSGPALWQLSDEDTTIYLFGTVHILPQELQWMDSRIESALNASDMLVTEVDTSDTAAVAAAFAQSAMLDEGKTLRGLMKEEDRAQYEELVSAAGMPPATFDSFEPWFAAVTLEALPLLMAGYDPSAGVEPALVAYVGDMPQGELETVADQIEIFDGMPMDFQLTYLDGIVENAGEAVESVNKLVENWAQGDTGALEDLLTSDLDMDDDYLIKRLLTDRNANWVDWIETRMEEPGTVFIAVGALHLAGESSVQNLLTDRGHVVTRITN